MRRAPARPRSAFNGYTHQQLVAMLAAGDPDSVRNTAQGWDGIGRQMHDQASSLMQRLTGFAHLWQGQAADQYQRMISDLATGLRTVADGAWTMRDINYDAADALDTARMQMPAPQAVPQLPSATTALAAAPVDVSGLSPQDASLLIGQQGAARAAVQSQQQAQAAADDARTQAVRIMTALADRYSVDYAAAPDLPDTGVATDSTAAGVGAGGAVPETMPVTGTATGSAIAGATAMGALTGSVQPLPVDATVQPVAADPTAMVGAADPSATTIDPGTDPVFGNFFREGLAAAGGAFAVARIPSLASRIRKTREGQPAVVQPGADAARIKTPDHAHVNFAGAGGAGGIGDVGGIGGVGGGAAIGTGAGIAPGAGDAPSAYAGFAQGSAGAGLGAAGVSAASAAGSTAGAGTPTGGFMGGMPIGAGMAGMGMDGSRRIPPWLVETEDVWGESSAVAPTVIGEEP